MEFKNQIRNQTTNICILYNIIIKSFYYYFIILIKIKTYSGSILVAVNPYRIFENLYNLNTVKLYQDNLIGILPP